MIEAQFDDADQFSEGFARWPSSRYVGETIIRTYGGAWADFDQTEQWGVRFDNGDGAFPISKVYKQLEGGEFDSVLSFYKILPKLRTHLKTQTPSQ